MNEEQKKEYKEKYYQEKQKGVKFWPDIIYKDLLASFAIFLLLVGLAIFVGVANEPKADPSDSTYIPRPEWYFLFLFQMLKYFPGEVEWIGTAVIPGLAVAALFLLPFFDRNPKRHWKKRLFAIASMSLIVILMVALTLVAVVTTPAMEETGTIAGTVSEQIVAGEELYALHCGECHGPDGDVTVIEGVEGLEGAVISPISNKDVIYALTDDTLFNLINLGLPNLGMPPFGKAFGGELGVGDIEAIATYMRYTWDDRVEIPQDALQGATIPALAAGEVPSYEVHISALVKRYCLSCHRPEKKNNQNYFMGTYEEILTSGDHAPNVTAGDMESNLLRMLRLGKGEEIADLGGMMPPNKALSPELIKLFELWVQAGMPNSTADAAQQSAPAESEAPVDGAPVEEKAPAETPDSALPPTATPEAAPAAAPAGEETATPYP